MEEMGRNKDEISLKLQNLEEQIPKLQQELHAALQSRDHLEQSSAAMRQQVADYEVQLADLSKQLQADMARESELEHLSQRLQASENKVESLTSEVEKAHEELQQQAVKPENKIFGPASQGSPESLSERTGDDVVSESESGAEISERSRGTSVKEIQQQHLFQLNDQLQDLERRNSRVSSQLRDALAAKEELHRRVTQLESNSAEASQDTAGSPAEEAIKQESPRIGQAEAKEVVLLRSEVAKSTRDTTRLVATRKACLCSNTHLRRYS